MISFEHGGFVLLGFHLLFLLVILLDQSTKYFVQRFLPLNGGITVLPGVLSLTYINNPGAAFGILPYKTVLLVVLTFLLFFLVFLFRNRIPRQPSFLRWGLALGLGGATGNLIDRLRFGSVIDFIDLRFWPMKNFPIFNIADLAISCGVLLILWYLRKQEQTTGDEEKAIEQGG